MNKLVFANLVQRPIRSLISIVAIAVEVTLILVIVGLSLGMLNDNAQRIKGIGADVMVRPPGASILLAGSAASISSKLGDVLLKQPHVTVAAPVITQLATGTSVEVIYGIDLKTYESLRPFHFLEGGAFTGPESAIVDNFFADSKHLHAGDKVEIFNRTFTISGVVENGQGARKFVPLATMQEMMGAGNKVSVFFVKADDSANADAIVNEIKHVEGLQQYSVITMREWLSLMTPDNIPGLNAFLKVVVAVAVIIGFIVIFQSMYTAVMERTREIGILKSMGASKFYIVNVIVRETIILALGGILLGVGISVLSRFGILHRFPTLRVEMTSVWVFRATLIAMIGAVLGAIYPAWKAARKDPIDALAYE